MDLIKTYYREIFMVILIAYGQYYHIKALNYEQIITEGSIKSKEISAVMNQQLRDEAQKAVQQQKEIQKIRNAKVSDDCQDSLNWMKGQFIN